MEESAVTVEMKGTIVFLPYAVGSKSESLKPFLYINKDEVIRIMMKGDNPFENNSLISHDGHFVLIKGNYGMGNSFLIEEIVDLSEKKTEIEEIEETKEIQVSEEE